ncbi:hypothetical protein RN001_008033 [Aquatica leii]|uniref:Uncharacterized protein n=1 Tax=Aquatica leii TaxID=1421715 RepID=A0AAN7SGB5_9COLE|nr:hypothetical protein RN001_008033 [Aquatica leii]
MQTFGFNPNLQKNVIEDKENIVPYEEDKLTDLIEDLKLQKLKHHLVEILMHPDQGIPLIYVEEYSNPNAEEGDGSSNYYNQFPELQRQLNTKLNDIPFKRSSYDAENRYMCQPSKEDVFRLLVALHEARQGPHLVPQA